MRIDRLEFEQIQKGKPGEVVMPVEPSVGDRLWVRASPRVAPVLAEVVDVWTVDGGFSALLKQVDRPARTPASRPSLRLTRAQRMGLFEGECPHIGGEGEPPVEAGETVQLSSKVTLRVIRVDVKAGKWTLRYELIDTRDPVRLLRRTPPAHREGSELDSADAGVSRQAVEQSHYTSSPVSAVPGDPGEAPDRVWMEVRAKAISEFGHLDRLKRLADDRKNKVERLSARSKAGRRRAA